MNLPAALQENDFNLLVSSFSNESEIISELTTCCRNTAVWQTELSFLGDKSPALVFLREMHSSALSAVACIAVGLYKPSASSMRAMVESCLYYTYFSSHPKELETLVRAPGYYASKSQIIQFHRDHSIDFAKRQEVFDLENKLSKWYGQASQIIHGQIPENWSQMTDLSKICRNEKIDKTATEFFVEAVTLIKAIFICTIDIDQWHSIAPKSRALMTKGLSKEQKNTLGLLS